MRPLVALAVLTLGGREVAAAPNEAPQAEAAPLASPAAEASTPGDVGTSLGVSPADASKAPPPAGRAAAAADADAHDPQTDAIIRAAEAGRERTAALEALAKALPATPKPAPAWAYNLRGRAESVGGNADAYTLGLDAGALGRWGKWATELKLGYGFGRNRLVTTPVANNGTLTARGERDYTELLSSYVLLGGLFDRVASIKAQGFGEVGLGLTAIDHTDGARILHRLRGTVGFRATYEARENYYAAPLGPASPPDHWIYAPTIGGQYRFALTRSIYVTEEALLAIDVERHKNLRATSDTGLNLDVTDALTLSLLFKVRYIGEPAPGRKTTDTTLAAALGVNF